MIPCWILAVLLGVMTLAVLLLGALLFLVLLGDDEGGDA